MLLALFVLSGVFTESQLKEFLIDTENTHIPDDANWEYYVNEVFGDAAQESLSFLTIKPDSRESTPLPYKATNLSVDEDIKTYWSAKTANKGEYLISDLGEKSTINAIQINYADQDADIMGKPETTLGHKYIIYT